MEKTIKSERIGREGYYVVREEIWRLDGMEDTLMIYTYTPDGDAIGRLEDAQFLCDQHGIRPRPAHDAHVGTGAQCAIGFCEAEQKWYGWSHRAMCGFGVGDVVKAGDVMATSGWTDEYLAEHPEADKRLPVGFTATTLDDARRMAQAFADGVS